MTPPSLPDAWSAPAPLPHASASLRRAMLLARILWRGGDVGEGGGGASVPLEIEALQQSSIISVSSMSMSEGGRDDALRSRRDDDCLGEAACTGDELFFILLLCVVSTALSRCFHILHPPSSPRLL